MDHKAKMDSFFMGTFVPRPTKQESVTSAHNLVMKFKEAPWGGTSWWCQMCGKWGSDDHANSKEHSTKTHELAACNEMIGVALSMRRFEKEVGLRGQLSSVVSATSGDRKSTPRWATSCETACPKALS